MVDVEVVRHWTQLGCSQPDCPVAATHVYLELDDQGHVEEEWPVCMNHAPEPASYPFPGVPTLIPLAARDTADTIPATGPLPLSQAGPTNPQPQAPTQGRTGKQLPGNPRERQALMNHPTAAQTGAGLTMERVETDPHAGGQPPALPSAHQRHQLHEQL